MTDKVGLSVFLLLFQDLFAIATDQPFRFPSTFTFVLRAFSTLEGAQSLSLSLSLSLSVVLKLCLCLEVMPCILA